MDNKRELFQIFTRRYGLVNRSCCDPKNLDISLIQSHLLYEIKRQHNPSMQQIAETLGTDITTFSRQIKGLVEKGLVKKTPHHTDNRVYMLYLTEEGEKIEESISQQMDTYFDEIFSYLSQEEQKNVLQSIKLLNDAMLKSNSCCQLPPY